MIFWIGLWFNVQQQWSYRDGLFNHTFFLAKLDHAQIQEFSSGGVQVSLTKKALMFFFLVLSLFYRSQMVNFKENYHFSMFQRGSNIFQGGPTFSRGGGCVQLLISYRNPYNLWFSRGGPDPLSPPPPLDPHLLTIYGKWLYNQFSVHILSLVTDNYSRRRRMTVENISWSISTIVWGLVGIKLTTPVVAMGHTTDSATGPALRLIA